MATRESTEPHLATRTTVCGGCDRRVDKGHHMVVRKNKSLIHEGCLLGEDGSRFGRPRYLSTAQAPDRVPGLRDDRYQRYTLVHPDGSGKVNTASRASTVVHAVEDTYNLTNWQKGNVLRGAAARPDLPALASSLSPHDWADKKKMTELIEQAEEAGGSKFKANLGTMIHGFCEQYDRTGVIGDVPRAYLPDVEAYARTLDSEGLTPVPDMIERTTMTSRWTEDVAGTFDNVYRDRGGRYRIGDKKTGSVGYSPASMYGQFAIYAEGLSEYGVYDPERGVWEHPSWDVDVDEALLIHLPLGRGQCHVYRADLNVGRAHIDECIRLRALRRVKHALLPYERVKRMMPEGGWPAVLNACISPIEVRMVGREIVKAGEMTDDLKQLGKDRIEALTA